MKLRLIVTGGGTGGHVFPALEVARLAKAEGHEVIYLGSIRGQEMGACKRAAIPFRGFPSEPLYSLKSPKGWRAAINLLRATAKARGAVRKIEADAVFSTGGYSSAPVVSAARSLGVPFVLHEQNSVPGRSNLLSAKSAYLVATTFHSAAEHFQGCRVERTGLPVRQELREVAASRRLELDVTPMQVLVVGGSQGAATLNEAVLATATRMTGRDLRWTHVTGRAHFETIFPTFEKLGLKNICDVKSFLEGPAMAEAYSRASLVIARSGAGTLSELAAFRLPSVLVPYPSAHANHQFHNAKEIEGLGAAVTIEQAALHPSKLQDALEGWIDDSKRREAAQAALMDWDQPDAARRIVHILGEAANSRRRS
ncbi:MAG TPA: undecaprenyldiphospho-muramoylpentapeptide beta-N-acetylglucosaminyltransferase [Fimbriimonadaceae bacterium]|nr:undecaprenyldiphospho-muramoylpentapeptide beta-N-acetylglucosaminyltransferase [Fimbriimonadaceae bacterium]